MVASAAVFDELISHGYKPLKRVQGCLPHQDILQSRESKDEDTRKYGKMVTIKKSFLLPVIKHQITEEGYVPWLGQYYNS